MNTSSPMREKTDAEVRDAVDSLPFVVTATLIDDGVRAVLAGGTDRVPPSMCVTLAQVDAGVAELEEELAGGLEHE